MPRTPCWIAGLLALTSAPALHAQPVGSCEVGTAQAFLETRTLRASLFNTGGLFYGGTTTASDGYLIPKRDSVSATFAASFWVGGRVGGDLRVAAARYGAYNFWPGPLADAEAPPADCAEHDRIFLVSRQDVARYLATGRATDDLRDWPVDAGAPVLDGDGVADNYNLAGGDQPAVPGDVAAFWVMNDAGNAHEQTGTAPLGIEVRTLAFAFDLAGPSALQNVTFYRYEVVNRNDQPIDSLFLSLWTDVDLGDASDDYVGTDTLRNLIYAYNASDFDELYGAAPPAWGVQVLDGFVGLANGRDDDGDGTTDEPDEELRLTSAPFAPKNFGPNGGDPRTASDYFNMQKGLFSDGSAMEARGFGFPGSYVGTDPVGPRTRFAFPADPVAGEFWTEVNADGAGNGNLNGDRRMVLSTGPGRLAPGASVDVLYAMPYARASSHLQSVAALRAFASVLATLQAQGTLAFRPVEAREYDGDDRPIATPPLSLSRVRPNPSTGVASVLLTLPAEAGVEAAVYDVLGRRLALVVDARLPAGETPLALPRGLAAGTYVLRVRVAPGGEETLTFTVAR